MGSINASEKSADGGRPLGKIEASLNRKLRTVKWGEYEFCKIFNQIKQGRRLKKSDQLPGNIPFVMAGVTNTGVINYISNPVASFPANSITVDIFGNTFTAIMRLEQEMTLVYIGMTALNTLKVQ